MFAGIMIGCLLALTLIVPPSDAVWAMNIDTRCAPVTVIALRHVEDLWGTPRGTVAGYYWAPTATIWVETDGHDPWPQTLLHELGHHDDYSCEDGTGGEAYADSYAARQQNRLAKECPI